VDGDPTDVEFLLAAARREIRVLQDDPRAAPTDGSRGAALRDHLFDLLGAVDHRLNGPYDPAAPPGVTAAFARSLRQSIAVLQAAHAALPWLAATHDPKVNLGSLYLAEELANTLIDRNVDLVMVADPQFMYSTVSWPFNGVVNGTAGFTPATTRRPIVLNYPLSDNDRLLLHPIFAHELGHAAVDEHGLVAEVQTKLDADPRFSDALHRAVADTAAIWPGLSQTRRAGALRGLVANWLTELLCDHLATAVSGPAFLWAFAGFVLPLSYDDHGQSHPPNTIRLRLVLDLLARQGWTDYMERVAPAVTVWLRGVAASATTGSADVVGEFLRSQAILSAPAVQDAAIARVGSAAVDPPSIESGADEAAFLLENVVLPVGDPPLAPLAILLGSWAEGFRRHGDSPEGLVASMDESTLQELVGKAIEMSTISSHWVGA
jgi:hypothetical protein